MPTTQSLDPEQEFLAALPIIEKQIRWICRQYRIRGSDRDDFSSYATYRIIANDYAVFRKLERRSRMNSYLRTVIRRLLLDYWNHEHGKWRPASRSRALGRDAVLMDRLLNRDGFGLEEAIGILRQNHRVPLTRRQLREMGARIPRRPRRRFEGEERLRTLAHGGGHRDLVARRERAGRTQEIQAALTRALRSLPADDRRLLELNFKQGWTVARIARVLEVRQRGLYTRIARCLRRLRSELKRQGIGRREAVEILGSDESSLMAVDFTAARAGRAGLAQASSIAPCR